jgi:uncharacterized membrane protein YdjX (TVP38/TMEM64 family)
MEAAGSEVSKSKSKIIIKAVILVAFIVTAILVVQFTPLKDYLTQEKLTGLKDALGWWGPLAFIVMYAVGICIFLPGTLLTGLGGALFGPYLGTVVNFIGAMIGACAAFFIGRTLGRDYAASLIGDRLKKYDDGIERNGFATVLYLRLVYFPFTPMNFGMGLTKVRFRDYFFGTGLGIMVGTFILTFFIGTIVEVVKSKNWSGLIDPVVFFSVALFIFSFFIPTIIKKIKGEVDESE